MNLINRRITLWENISSQGNENRKILWAGAKASRAGQNRYNEAHGFSFNSCKMETVKYSWRNNSNWHLGRNEGMWEYLEIYWLSSHRVHIAILCMFMSLSNVTFIGTVLFIHVWFLQWLMSKGDTMLRASQFCRYLQVLIHNSYAPGESNGVLSCTIFSTHSLHSH